jgi:aryl sulfotransferase
MTETIAGPTKIRELHNHHFDSTIWNDLQFRDDDIIISTYAKSGTTWMQQIVAQMLLGPDPELEVAEISPWLDLRVPPKAVKLPMVEAQTHRRFLKTHLPLDALVFSPAAKYIYIGRDGRDVVWSMYNHHVNANEIWYEALNRHARARRAAHRAASRRHPTVLSRVVGSRRPSLLALLGERSHLVGVP